ncbi:hypothetical protein AMS68_005005 [Peltaster fructicola]|uniref:C2H2-type domain-containing protein n=1 Tax=Peltaster fructicola TaxID=286661 RepID=A0A6H0XY19_9PEZI|nr:hypothetical protein AMS68_005005 [Peltaster fructicola]
MTKRKRNQPTVEDILERPWCFYCERDFDDLKILISHQKAKHYKCTMCTRRLNTAGGLSVHMSQVHKETLTAIENALPVRKDVNIEIFGMEGIPEDVLHQHRQRITAEYFKKVAERRAETGNPPAGSGQNSTNKRPKIETAEEIKQRLAEHKAKKEAERLARADGERGSTTPVSSTGAFATPGAADGATQGSPVFMDAHQSQGSPFAAPPPAFGGHPMPPGPQPIMSPSNQYYGPPIPSPLGPAPPFGLPPHMPPHMPPHGMPMYPGGPPPFPLPHNGFGPSPGAMPFPPMHQHNMPRPTGPPFANGHQPPTAHQTRPKPAAEPVKQQSTLDLDVPGLPARPSTNAPNLSREDMTRLHAGAPARQANPSHATLPSPGGATEQSGVVAAALADGGSKGSEEHALPVREFQLETSNTASTHVTHNDPATSSSSAAAHAADNAEGAAPVLDSSSAVVTSDTTAVAASEKTPKTASTKKAGKKGSKSADKQIRMVYTDETMSPEEKRAAHPRYAFKRDDSTTYVQGEAGPAVTGPVRGIAGITAGKALSNASVNDFMIVEYNEQIGGRARHASFGKKSDGSPYTIELGANWVQGLGTPPGPENPIWTLAKKYHLNNTYSNYSDILTYDSTGYKDYSAQLDDFENRIFDTLSADAGNILTNGLLDHSVRAGLYSAGWFPDTDPIKQAIEWWEWDWEVAYPPSESSELFGIAGYNLTFNQFSEANNFATDQRGFNIFIKGFASEYLKNNDPRLLLNTTVTSIDYSSGSGVTVYLRPTVNSTSSAPTCITAKYAINTFSLGVLQQSIAGNAPVSFKLALPAWKQSAILNFNMGIYTKIFLQFPADQQFWDTNVQFMLYADPATRGYYPLWQSLSTTGFFPASGILFVTVVHSQSRRVEAQSDEQTLKEVLAVLQTMFPQKKIPKPTAFYYPRWGRTEWAHGSYSNWPTGVTLDEHQNLRANVGRLWFAGEHTSAEYFGFLHGGYYEGMIAGQSVAACIKGKCNNEPSYSVLRANAGQGTFDASNGWVGGEQASFATYGLAD